MAAWEDDKHPWLTDLKLFLKQALDSNIPILGLCLGAQLLAFVVGGNTYVGDKGQEFGYLPLEWTESAENDSFCQYIRSNGLDKTMPYSHGDTFSFNSNAQYTKKNGQTLKISVLARTKTPYTAMFKVGELSYGIQAHPECNNELHDIWITLDEEAMRAKGQSPEALRKQSNAQKTEQERNGCLLLSKWFDLCIEKAASRDKLTSHIVSKL